MHPTSDRGPFLLRLPNWLGDLVLAFATISSAAEANRDGILFVGPASFRPLLLARYPWAGFLPWSHGLGSAPLGAIRRARPRTALLLTDSLSSALALRLAGVPERIGYAAELRDAFLTRCVPRSAPSRAVRRAAEYAVLGRASGLRIEDDRPRIAIIPEERSAGEAALGRAGIAAQRYAVLAPGAVYGPAKRWEPARFADVAAFLEERHGLRSVLVGAHADIGSARETERRSAQVASLVGETDLPTLAGVLSGAAIVVSNDSGVMHLGAALGRPTIGVFGSTSPVWTSADAPWVRNLYAAYPCSPCFRRTCPIGYGCLRSIDSARALRAADELLTVASEKREEGGLGLRYGQRGAFQ